MPKYLLIATILASTSLFSNLSHAATHSHSANIRESGRCAKQASAEALNDFNTHISPDTDMDLMVVSSHESATEKGTYVVRYGSFDGNQGVTVDATVKLSSDCKLQGAITTKTVGYYDGE